MRDHLHSHNSLDREAFPLVSWHSISRALDQRSPSFRAWMTKHVSGHCGVGSKMRAWGFWDNDQCPCCGMADETTRHLPLCTAQHMVDEYDKQTLSLIQWMSDSHTHPGIIDYFTTALTHKALPSTVPIEHASDLQQAMANQSKIGWDNLFFGRIADSWRSIQRQHLLSTPSRRSAETWTADFIYHLLQFSHSLWLCRNNYVHQ